MTGVVVAERPNVCRGECRVMRRMRERRGSNLESRYRCGLRPSFIYKRFTFQTGVALPVAVGVSAAGFAIAVVAAVLVRRRRRRTRRLQSPPMRMTEMAEFVNPVYSSTVESEL